MQKEAQFNLMLAAGSKNSSPQYNVYTVLKFECKIAKSLLAIPVSFLLKSAGPVSLTKKVLSILSSSLSMNVMLFGMEIRVWSSRTKGITAKAGIASE